MKNTCLAKRFKYSFSKTLHSSLNVESLNVGGIRGYISSISLRLCIVCINCSLSISKLTSVFSTEKRVESCRTFRYSSAAWIGFSSNKHIPAKPLRDDTTTLRYSSFSLIFFAIRASRRSSMELTCFLVAKYLPRTAWWWQQAWRRASNGWSS